MSMILSDARYDKLSDSILKLMMSLPDIAEVDERGRNAIYNALCAYERVSRNNYVALIEELVKLECNPHQQDREGKTPLHVAVEVQSGAAVEALLVCGADVNLVDFSGESPFSYSVKSLNYFARVNLLEHLRKLRQIGLEVSELNIRHLTQFDDQRVPREAFKRDQLEKTKKVKIGQRGLTLYDFVFEKDVVKLISLFTPEERDIVGTVLGTIAYETFSSLRDILKLQYRKVLDRLPLIEPAATSLKILVGFPMPDVCVIIVLKFLTNVDLKSLISATIERDD